MRVLFDHQVFSKQKYGGVSRYFCELCCGLRSLHHVDVRLFAGLITNGYLHQYSDRLSGCLSGVFLPEWIPECLPLSFTNRHLVEYTARSFDADIYHPTSLRWMLGSFRGRRVITIQDMIPERLAHLWPQKDSTPARKRFAVERVDGILCPSDTTRNDLQELLDVPASKIRVVHHGISLSAPDVPSDPPLPPGPPYFLYVGDRHSYKNFPLLLTAFSRCSSLRLKYRLVCFGGGRPTEDERRQIERAGWRSRVLFLRGNDTMLASLYAGAFTMIYTSRYEGFGLPVLEAMNLGCPVVTSTGGSLAEIAGDGALLFDPADADALSAHLESLTSSSSLREQMIARGRERARHFGWARTAAETLAFYREVSGKN